MRLFRDLKITQKSTYFITQRLREACTQAGDKMRGSFEVN